MAEPTEGMDFPEELAGCTLLGSFGILLQMGLGLIALSTLLLKRHRERPRRPLRVWLYDASKQAIAQAVIHFLSILLAMGLGVRERHGVQDMCVWYFLNIMLDTTIGVLLLAGFHAIVRAIAKRKQIKSLESGNYGKPPRLSIWAIQLVVFIFNIALVKLTIGLILWLFPKIGLWTSDLFEPLKGHPNVELTIVMVVVPFVMNVFQFWAIDAVIKDPNADGDGYRSRRHGYYDDPEDGDVFMLSENAYGIDAEL